MYSDFCKCIKQTADSVGVMHGHAGDGWKMLLAISDTLT